MNKEILIVALLLVSLLDNTSVSWSFTEIGLGDIRVGPLEHVQKNASFSSQITGQATLNITLYKKGSLTIKITINNITFSISKTRMISVFLNPMNTINIDIINTLLEEGVVYGNSTITIISTTTKNSVAKADTIVEWSRVLFIFSIAIPPIILALVPKETEKTAEEFDEATIIEG